MGWTSVAAWHKWRKKLYWERKFTKLCSERRGVRTQVYWFSYHFPSRSQSEGRLVAWIYILMQDLLPLLYCSPLWHLTLLSEVKIELLDTSLTIRCHFFFKLSGNTSFSVSEVLDNRMLEFHCGVNQIPHGREGFLQYHIAHFPGNLEWALRVMLDNFIYIELLWICSFCQSNSIFQLTFKNWTVFVSTLFYS